MNAESGTVDLLWNIERRTLNIEGAGMLAPGWKWCGGKSMSLSPQLAITRERRFTYF
jgi:hypothetical protein